MVVTVPTTLQIFVCLLIHIVNFIVRRVEVQLMYLTLKHNKLNITATVDLI